VNKKDAKEAAPILQRSLKALLNAVPTEGSAVGSDLRTACGRLAANAEALLLRNAAGPPLANCFDLAFQAGATQAELAIARNETLTEAPVTVGATIIKQSIIGMCLATEGRAIARMTFTSREDVDALKLQMNQVFNAAEEVAADEMAQMTYRALVGLHGAVTFYLVDTARPLPRMVQYRFYGIMPSLVMANRLYYDARRADQLRAENKVVHPAFMPAAGRALSA